MTTCEVTVDERRPCAAAAHVGCGGNSRLSLVPASSAARSAGRDGVSLRLQLILKALEAQRRLARAVGYRLRQEPVGEPRVAGQEGAVQVRPEDPAVAAALESALAVVAESREHAAERLGALVEVRSAGVVLESCEGAPLARLELALQQH